MAEMTPSRHLMSGLLGVLPRNWEMWQLEKWPCAGGNRRLHFEAVNRGAEG